MPDRQEIIAALTSFVETKFNGNWSAAFHHYADGSDRVGLVGLVLMLKDAGVGGYWTRTPIGRAIIREMDENSDGLISYLEFRAKFEAES